MDENYRQLNDSAEEINRKLQRDPKQDEDLNELKDKKVTNLRLQLSELDSLNNEAYLLDTYKAREVAGWIMQGAYAIGRFYHHVDCSQKTGFVQVVVSNYVVNEDGTINSSAMATTDMMQTTIAERRCAKNGVWSKWTKIVDGEAIGLHLNTIDAEIATLGSNLLSVNDRIGGFRKIDLGIDKCTINGSINQNGTLNVNNYWKSSNFIKVDGANKVVVSSANNSLGYIAFYGNDNEGSFRYAIELTDCNDKEIGISPDVKYIRFCNKISGGNIIVSVVSSDETGSIVREIVGSSEKELQFGTLGYVVGYWKTDGTINTAASASSHKACFYKINEGKIRFGNGVAAGASYGIIKDKSGNIVHTFGTNIANTEIEIPKEWSGGALCINYFSFATNEYVHSMYVTENGMVDDKIKDNDAYLFGIPTTTYPFGEIPNVLGYWRTDGTINNGSSAALAHKACSLPLKEGTIKFGQGIASQASYGIVKDKNGNIVETLGNNIANTELNIPKEWVDGTLCVNYFNYASGSEVNSLEFTSYGIIDVKLEENNAKLKNELINSTLSNIVEKPFSFSNKSALFFGDSITFGYTSGTTTTENNYPKQFCDAVGIRDFVNYGIGGSGFIRSTISSIMTINDRIKSVQLNRDYMFVAGGVNDWQAGATEEEMYQALDDICQYISSHYTGKVIFITPINHCGVTPSGTPTQSLNNVRKIITEKALEYGFNVIQGSQFNFPTESNALANVVFGDKIHPSEKGYTMYSRALRTILL